MAVAGGGIGFAPPDGGLDVDVADDDGREGAGLLGHRLGRRHLGAPGEREPVEDHHPAPAQVVLGRVEQGGEDDVALGRRVVAGLEQDVTHLVLVQDAGVVQAAGQCRREGALARTRQPDEHDHPGSHGSTA